MNETTCPEEADLLPLTSGEPVPDPVQEHVRTCPTCRERLKQMLGEITKLRRIRRDALQTAVIQPQAPAPPDGAAGVGGTQESLSTASWSSVSRRPAHIGNYFIAGQLDDSAMAVAYRALHPTLNKELVIKLGRQAGVGAAEHQLLLEDGKLLAQLDHPHLVRVHDLDFQNNRPFLVMEYVPGCSLKQYAEEMRPSPRQAAALVAKVARALGEVHRRGLVHHEIHPGVIRIDEAGEPHLEFGLTSLRQRPALDDSRPVEGALAYLAPEQARADRDQAGPRSDLCALGGVLYFLLTGKAPFASLERLRRGEFDQAALQASGAPRRLQAICARALAADPARRYASADDLAGALERCGRSSSRLKVLALAGILLLAVAGAVLYLVFGGND